MTSAKKVMHRSIVHISNLQAMVTDLCFAIAREVVPGPPIQLYNISAFAMAQYKTFIWKEMESSGSSYRTNNPQRISFNRPTCQCGELVVLLISRTETLGGCFWDVPDIQMVVISLFGWINCKDQGKWRCMVAMSWS